MATAHAIKMPGTHRLVFGASPEVMVGRADETEYLLSSPANRERLYKAVQNVERGENLISFESIGDAMSYAEGQARA